MRPVIILFAKAPVAGAVKTRLQPVLSAVQSAALHAAFVEDTLELLSGVNDLADLELHTDTLSDAWASFGVATKLQTPGDLGARMYSAVAAGLEEGRESVTIVGSDAPDLPESHLRGILGAAGDVVLGPATDGGYYAIRCRRAHPEMFGGVRWSGSQTLEDTVAAATRCGLAVGFGAVWHDVDEPSDLERVLRSGRVPRHTAQWAIEAGFRLT